MLFRAPCAVAVTIKVLPISSDTFDPTADEVVKEMLVGIGFTTTLVVLACPQATKKTRHNSMQPNAARRTNLPMDPSVLRVKRAVLENHQCRGCRFFQQPSTEWCAQVT